jgi:hypothetical protein
MAAQGLVQGPLGETCLFSEQAEAVAMQEVLDNWR